MSNGGGNQPRWRRDGKELFYFAPDSTLTAASVMTAGAHSSLVFPKHYSACRCWVASPDGRRFLIKSEADRVTASPVTIVLNWQAALKK